MSANRLVAHSIVDFGFLSGRGIHIGLLTLLKFFLPEFHLVVFHIQLSLNVGP